MVMRRRVARKGAKKAPRRRQFGMRPRRRLNIKTSQVFTETQKAGTECLGVNAQGEVFIQPGFAGQGVKLLTQMNVLPQKSQYSNLYQAYKIIKAKFTIIPKWVGETQNEAAIGTAGGIGITETPRMAYAINNYDQSNLAPSTELEVLQDNGCKVRHFTKPVVITTRPKPLTQETVDNALIGPQLVNTQRNTGTWIEWDGAGSTVPHVGVDAQFSAPNSLSTGFLALADVYVTVSFVCKDPR